MPEIVLCKPTASPAPDAIIAYHEAHRGSGADDL